MSADSSSSLTPGQRRKAALIAGIGVPLMAALGSTYRWRVDGFSHYESIVASGRQPIFAFWHGRILPATLFWKDHGIVVIISRNFDGEWIARTVRRFGYDTARGSSSRGGARALVQMRRALAEGRPVGFTLDGPRGPARVVQPGAVWLAGATGSPILPFHMEADRSWTARSWDQTQVPQPFSRVALAIGAPVFIANTDEAEMEAGRRTLENTLEIAVARAHDLLRDSKTSSQ